MTHQWTPENAAPTHPATPATTQTRTKATPTPEQLTAAHAARRARLIEALRNLEGDNKVDYLLVTNLVNIRYLTGFSGSDAALLLGTDGTTLLSTDGRYTTQIAIETPDIPAMIERNPARAVVNALREKAGEGTVIGVEASISLQASEAYAPTAIVPNLVEELRMIKDDIEIYWLEEAARIADAAWESLLADGILRAGVSEARVAAELEYRMRLFGAEGTSFDTIVASGQNGAKPHAGASDDLIVPGLVTVDFGVWKGGYASDQTRTVIVRGDVPVPALEVNGKTWTQEDIVDTVWNAFLAGVAAVKPGAALRDVDTAARSVVEAAGLGEYFNHSTGHGVGLDVHEAPYAASATDPAKLLKAGQTITVEPGVYIEGLSGARIENTLLVTDYGARPLNLATPAVRLVG